MNDIKVLYRKMTKDAKEPSYSHNTDSGADLYSAEDFTIKPGEIKIVGTGICIEIAKGIEGQVRPKSGLAMKGMSVVNSPGTIDAGYRGEIKVILINLGKEKLSFNKGDKIAQIVFTPVYKGHFIEMLELSGSGRGTGGFGSTGLQ
jgi:dUTP pyrophosphatase